MNITDILQSSSTGTGVAQSATIQKYGSTKDQFLKLLLAQLKNQDPLAAPDADKMAGQITAFGQLEQLMNLNVSMESMAKAQGSQQQNQAVSLVGKSVQVQNNLLHVQGENKGKISFNLSAPSSTVTVQVKNPLGQVIRTIEYKDIPAGLSTQDFDGKSQTGEDLNNGDYHIEVAAKGVGDNRSVSAIPVTQGIVGDVQFTAQGPVLIVNGQAYTMGQVLSVGNTAPSA